MVDIVKATEQYESWLGRYIPLVAADLKTKHQVMASGAFPFLRGTFYRWLQQWDELCGDLKGAPVVLGVGDIHVENYGTWRDAEGRLIWGINDFDEACRIPYTLDLLRLVVSACMAIEASSLRLDSKTAVDAAVDGYARQIARGGQPFVLEERYAWLRPIALNVLREPVRFWEKMRALPLLEGDVPVGAAAALEQMLPQPGIEYTAHTRIAGIGSLGHPRIVALADYEGGAIAREAKALVPSALAWERGDVGSVEILYQAILMRAVRCHDPLVRLQGQWIVRRLAPDCSRIELSGLPELRDEEHLLRAMGQELANVHLGTRGASKAIAADLKSRKSHWHRSAVDRMHEAVNTDFDRWKRKA